MSETIYWILTLKASQEEKFPNQSFPPQSVLVCRHGMAWLAGCLRVDINAAPSLSVLFFTSEGWGAAYYSFQLSCLWWDCALPALSYGSPTHLLATRWTFYFSLAPRSSLFFREESFLFSYWLSPQKQQTPSHKRLGSDAVMLNAGAD